MKIFMDRSGLYVIFCHATPVRRAIGFKIKRASAMLFSERYGYCPGFRVGSVWFGTYGNKRGKE